MRTLIVNKNLIEKYNFFLFILLFTIKPLNKYWEYSFNGLRINYSSLLLILLVFELTLLINYITNKKIKTNSLYHSNKGNVLLLFITIIILILTLITPIFSLNNILSFTNYLVFLEVYISSSISYILLFIIGYYSWGYFITNKKTLLTVWTLQSIIYLTSAFFNNNGFYIITNDQPIYLLLSDSYAITSIVLINIIIPNKRKLIIFSISLLILFILMSRVTIVLFSLVFLIYSYKSLGFSRSTFLLLFVSLSLALFVYNYSVFDYYNHSDKNNRMLRLIVKKEKDSSLIKREKLLYDGINSLKENWITGEYMSYLKENNNERGKYIHNYLSFWKQYGIIPFVLLLLTLLYISIHQIIYLLSSPQMLINNILFYLFLFLLGEIILARAFVSPYIFLPIGMFFSINSKVRKS